jgi:hypothetical protein
MVPSVWSSSDIRRFAKRKWDLPFLLGVLWQRPRVVATWCTLRVLGAGYSFPRLKTITSQHAVRTVDRTMLTWISVFSACVLSRSKNNSCKQVVHVRQYIQRVWVCYVFRHWKWVSRFTLSVAAGPRYALATGLVSKETKTKPRKNKKTQLF